MVPEFPRFIDQPVRDWIGAAVENLQGFNADDAARLLLPGGWVQPLLIQGLPGGGSLRGKQ